MLPIGYISLAEEISYITHVDINIKFYSFSMPCGQVNS